MWLSKISGLQREAAVVITDERVSLMNEILKASQLIKLYAWESSFMIKIGKVRNQEIIKIRASAYTKAMSSSFAASVPLVCAGISFVFYTLIAKQTLTPAKGTKLNAYIYVD